LMLQAFLLYLPRVIWHIWENGLMHKMLSGAGKLSLLLL